MAKMITVNAPGDTVYLMDDQGIIRSAVVGDDGNLTTQARTDEDRAADPNALGVVRRRSMSATDAERTTHALVVRTLAGLPSKMIRISDREIDRYADQQLKFIQFGDSDRVFVRLVTES